MARPEKQGLEYFSLDVDFFDDPKIEFVSARFGIKGEIITVKLLTRIYRNGYFLEWNEDMALLFAKRAGDGITDTLVNDVVQELVKRDFFDKTFFDSFGILTSRGIQKRFIEGIKRRKSVEVIEPFLLPEVVNVCKNIENVSINPGNAYINSQSKVKESKAKERTPLPPSGGASILEAQFLTFWQEYPKKADKEKARKAFQKIKPDEAMFGLILSALIAQKRNNWQHTEKKFIPLPSSWLNGKRWEDEIVTAVKPPSQKSKLPSKPEDYNDSLIWMYENGYAHNMSEADRAIAVELIKKREAS